MEILRQAIKASGGLSVVASRLSRVTPQQLGNWVVRGVPIDHCADVELAVNGRISRRDLRPNDWARIWPELVTDEFPATAPTVDRAGGVNAMETPEPSPEAANA